MTKKQILNQSRHELPAHLSEDAKAYYKEFPERPDVQARPGLKMALENILTGRKPKLRVKGSVDKSALPDGVLIADLTAEGGGVTIIGSKLPKSWLFWSECSRYDVDSGCWEMHSTEPVLDMLKLLPDWWPHCYPIEIHPEFIPWFRMNYEITVKNDWERFGDSPYTDHLLFPVTRYS